MQNALQSPAVTAGLLTKFLPRVPSALLKPSWNMHHAVWGKGAAFHRMGPSSRWLMEQVPEARGRRSRTTAAGPAQPRGPARSRLKRKVVQLEAAKAFPQLSLSRQGGNGVNPRHMRNKQKILSTERCSCMNRNDVLKRCMLLSMHRRQCGQQPL